MRAGDRNRRIVLRRAANATDDYGGRVTVWTTLATVWAEHLAISDGERLRAAQMGASATDRFRVLKGAAWADLSAQDQLTFAGRTYAIDGVKPIENGVGLEITATARSDG